MSYWALFIIVMVASYIVYAVFNHRFNKFSQIPSPAGLTGAEIARLMLKQNGINDVNVVLTEGKLTDHYNPTDNTINLSEAVFGGTSVAACAVAAHETGHAIQHACGYAPIKLRSALVPIVSFASSTVQWVILIGLVVINVFPTLIWVGIGLFATTTLFSFITLPVEINASRRAIQWLDGAGIVDAETKPMVVSALNSAAYTYVMAAVSSLASLLYYTAMARRR